MKHFENVIKLKHGHYFTVKGDELEVQQWYDLKEKLKNPVAMNPTKYRELLKRAVEIRLRSDVPLGLA